MAALTAHVKTTQKLFINLFKAYTRVDCEEFRDFIKDTCWEWERNCHVYKPKILMNECNNKQSHLAGMKKSGASDEFNHGSRHGIEELGELICGCLLSLGNDNADNCGNKMTSCSDLDKEKMGLHKFCGGEVKAQMFDMGWMKMAKKVWSQWKRTGVNVLMRKVWMTKKIVEAHCF
jgi:hypothetical protein